MLLKSKKLYKNCVNMKIKLFEILRIFLYLVFKFNKRLCKIDIIKFRNMLKKLLSSMLKLKYLI